MSPAAPRAASRSRRPRTDDPLAVAVGAAVVLGLCALAGAAFWPPFQTWRLAVVVLAATISGGAIAAAGARWRWPAAVVAAAAIGVFAAVGVQLVLPDRTILGVLPTFSGLVDLFGAVVPSWRQLVTIGAPVGDFGALLVVPFVTVLASTVVSVSVVLRARRPGWAVTPPLGVALAAIVFGTDTAAAPIALGVGFVVVAVAWSAWRHARARSHLLVADSGDQEDSVFADPATRRRAASTRAAVGAALLAVAATVGVLGGNAIAAGTDRVVLRDVIEPPFDPRDYPSPLAAYRAIIDPPERELLTVTGLPAGSSLRMAVFDAYDGVVYNVAGSEAAAGSGEYRRIADSVARDVDSVGDSVEVHVQIGALGELGQIWVPTVGDLTTVRFEGARAAARGDALYYNAASESLVSTAGVSSGDAYTIDAQVPDATTPHDTDRAADTALPDAEAVPEQVADLASEWVGDASTPLSRAQALEAHLSQEGFFSDGLDDDDAKSRPGHGADRIAELLASEQMIGDDEQYATAMALMANHLGLPARVVLGFRPTEGQASAGPVVVTGEDVAAWVEIEFADAGWVEFDPTPDESRVPQEQAPRPQSTPRPQVLLPPPPPDQPPRPPVSVLEDTASNEDADDTDDPTGGLPTWLTAGLLGVGSLSAVIVLPLLMIVGVKAMRRRRRRTGGDPAHRFASGWDEIVDTAVDLRVDRPARSTRRETAAVVDAAFGAEAGGVLLAERADAAVFGPAEPDAEDAEAFWRLVDSTRRGLGESVGTWSRLRARCSVRSLRGGG